MEVQHQIWKKGPQDERREKAQLQDVNSNNLISHNLSH